MKKVSEKVALAVQQVLLSKYFCEEAPTNKCKQTQVLASPLGLGGDFFYRTGK